MFGLKRLFAWQISTDAFDRYWAERFAYASAIIVLVLGVRALPDFNLTGGEQLLGFLGVVNISLLLIVGGALTGLGGRRRKSD